MDEAITDKTQTGRTDEIMAKKLGVSRNTYRDIDTVMKQGTPNQIARMDKGGKCTLYKHRTHARRTETALPYKYMSYIRNVRI